MVPQIAERKIGKAMVIDIKGDFSGSWALKGKARIAQAMSKNDSSKLVFNLRQTTSLDTLGVKSMLENVPEDGDLVVVPGSLGDLDLLKRYLKNRRLFMYQSEDEIASVFGADCVEAKGLGEQRQRKRLDTAIPLEFEFEEGGERVSFRAVVTNLSETGLFAEYIDLDTAEQSLKRLDPHDLKSLHLKVFLPMRKRVELEGQVVHHRLEGEQLGIGIQFTSVGEKESAGLRSFMKNSGIFDESVETVAKGR